MTKWFRGPIFWFLIAWLRASSHNIPKGLESNNTDFRVIFCQGFDFADSSCQKKEEVKNENSGPLYTHLEREYM